VEGCVLIPLKRLEASKSRLSKYLSVEERVELTKCMLRDVLNVCLDSGFSRVLLITQGEIDFIYDNKIEVINNDKELNVALLEAISSIKGRFNSYLILPADIPLIEKSDLEQMKKLMESFDILISPSFDSGTNALFMKRGKEIELEYGEGKKSFLLHLENALNKGLNVVVFSNERIGMDIDDLARLRYLAHLNINKESVLYVRRLYEKNRNIWLGRNT